MKKKGMFALALLLVFTMLAIPGCAKEEKNPLERIIQTEITGHIMPSEMTRMWICSLYVPV